MTLPMKLGKTSAKGSLNLFYGIVVSNVILALGAIIVARLLGASSYGLYTLSSVPATFLGLFAGFGIRQAMVKYTAQFSYHNEIEKVRRTVISGLLFVAISSLTLALFTFFLSGWIANLLARPHAESLIKIFSLTVLTDALIVVSQSVFVGLEKIQYYSILLIFQAILRTSISPILIVIGLGPLGAVGGYTLSSLVTCVLGILLMHFVVIKGLGFTFAELLSNLKRLIGYGNPLYVSRLTEGFRTQFLNFMMVMYASDVLIGNYTVALNFQILVAFFATPIATVLFPAFSRLEFRLNQKSLRTFFQYSVKYTSLIVIPVTVVLVVLSENIVSTLYGDGFPLAPLYLSFSTLTFLYAAFGQYSITALLNGQGETKKSMILSLANVALAISLALILIPHFQIPGLIISLIVSSFPSIVLGSLWVKKLYNISIDWNQALKILSSSFMSGALTFATIRYFALPNLFGLLIGLAIFASSFIILAPLIGAINLGDISNLQTLSNEMGKISRLMELPLLLLSMLCKS